MDECGTLIEVKVMTKAHKRNHKMVSSTPTNEQNAEEDQRPRHKWCETFQEQTRPIMKEHLQSLKNQRTNKISSEPKDNKQRLDFPKHLRLKSNVSKEISKE